MKEESKNREPKMGGKAMERQITVGGRGEKAQTQRTAGVGTDDAHEVGVICVSGRPPRPHAPEPGHWAPA